MNAKDYKAIAEISKIYNDLFPSMIPIEFFEALADYFKKEDKGTEWWTKEKGYHKIPQFNKKQFLKDCGL